MQHLTIDNKMINCKLIKSIENLTNVLNWVSVSKFDSFSILQSRYLLTFCILYAGLLDPSNNAETNSSRGEKGGKQIQFIAQTASPSFDLNRHLFDFNPWNKDFKTKFRKKRALLGQSLSPYVSAYINFNVKKLSKYKVIWPDLPIDWLCGKYAILWINFNLQKLGARITLYLDNLIK